MELPHPEERKQIPAFILVKAWKRPQGINMSEKLPVVYILASKRNGTLYTGVTNNLPGRVWQHKNHVVEGFTKEYNVHQLVYFELHGDMEAALERENQIKKWKRKWKVELIQEKNPEWRDLYEDIL